MLKPAVEGSGVAAGGAVRAVVELQVRQILHLNHLVSNTPINIVRATVEGLKQLETRWKKLLPFVLVSDLA